jgi:hypothetical protein
MPRQKKATRKRTLRRWTGQELKDLRKQAGKESLAKLARTFKRTPAAIRLKASVEGISLRLRSR